jgi:hypothetical protein
MNLMQVAQIFDKINPLSQEEMVWRQLLKSSRLGSPSAGTEGKSLEYKEPPGKGWGLSHVLESRAEKMVRRKNFFDRLWEMELPLNATLGYILRRAYYCLHHAEARIAEDGHEVFSSVPGLSRLKRDLFYDLSASR